ncbi:MAG TPA: VOC family protein [Opitutaceae bacterium]|nr:VOC family protein [Opitutaceae bacterium]
MKILEIAFTGYTVTDVKRARAFYEGVLGLETSRIWGEEPAPDWIEYDIGSGCLAIVKGDGKLWQPSPHGTAAAFEVDDFQAFVDKIKAANVKIVMDVYESPVCWMLTIADPDDNRLVIHKRKNR